tara:strand:- start:27 stop:431 length:405 start_codon:yes stop_codon:yes gene_type:complete
MSKFIQFNTQVSGAVQPAEPIGPTLINVEDIQSFAATGAAGAPKTLVISLLGRAGGTAGQAGFRTLTLTFSTSITGGVVPATVNGQPNPFIQALVAAMSQDVPGVAVYQLGNDQSTAAAAPNGVQMYIRTAVFA